MPLALAVVLMSLTGSPVFIAGFLGADEVTPVEQRTEASTWVTVANNLGSSFGTALAGAAVAGVAEAVVFVGLAALLLVAGLPGVFRPGVQRGGPR